MRSPNQTLLCLCKLFTVVWIFLLNSYTNGTAESVSRLDYTSYSLFPSLNRLMPKSDSADSSPHTSRVSSEVLSSISSSTATSAASSALAWSLKTSILSDENSAQSTSLNFSIRASQPLLQPYLSFIRYERDERAYQPFFEDLLYFSCAAWVPENVPVASNILLAEQAREILQTYFVVPFSEWQHSYDSTKFFSHYAKLTFPNQVNIRLLIKEEGLAILLFSDGGAIFLAQKLNRYQLDLARKYRNKLRTGQL